MANEEHHTRRKRETRQLMRLNKTNHYAEPLLLVQMTIGAGCRGPDFFFEKAIYSARGQILSWLTRVDASLTEIPQASGERRDNQERVEEMQKSLETLSLLTDASPLDGEATESPQRASEEMAVLAKPNSCWIKAVVIVYFDLEFGQKVEHIYPPEVELSKEEESNLVFLSFPDSHSNSTGDTIFSFRFPRVSSQGAVSNSIESVHLNGFVFNRVQRDQSIRRGYLQKSIVILSERSDILLWPLLRHTVAIIGPEYFACRETTVPFIESVYHELSLWPAPNPGTIQEFPVLGNVVRYYVVCDEFLGLGYEGSVSNLFYSQALLNDTLSPVDELTVYENLYLMLPDLWALWELLLLGESLLVVGQTPEQTSTAILCLLSLLTPLRYGGEWRPYFTIHDSDFKRLSNTHTMGNCIVGITNPFFLREWKDWPHKLILAPDSSSRHSLTSLGSSAPVRGHDPASGVRSQLQSRHHCMLSPGSALLEELMPLKVTIEAFPFIFIFSQISLHVSSYSSREVEDMLETRIGAISMQLLLGPTIEVFVDISLSAHNSLSCR